MEKLLQQDNSTKQTHIKKLSLAKVAQYSFSGPLPPPEVLQKYESACKGSSNRIIKMAENQSKHRQQIEKKVINSNIANEKVGMIFAFILTAIFIISGATLILFDKQVAGYLALFGVGGFNAYNYLTKRREEKNKSRAKEAK
jgi:uncharacterized membrane protein